MRVSSSSVRLPRVGAGHRVIRELQQRGLRVGLDVHAAFALLRRLLGVDGLGRRVRWNRLKVLPRECNHALRLDVAHQISVQLFGRSTSQRTS
jgi:hypothetical protein